MVCDLQVDKTRRLIMPHDNGWLRLSWGDGNDVILLQEQFSTPRCYTGSRRNGKKRTETLIPIGPGDMGSLKNENAVIILIRYKVFYKNLLKRRLQRTYLQRSAALIPE